MQPRDTSRLESTAFDVLVVGGGIHGLATAYEAASRGLRTALVEAGDFGSAASFNHQKTVHGGLRSLQSLRIGRAREGVRERRALARIAPWFLRPLPFVVGTYRSVTRGRAALRAGFRLEQFLARDRNEGVERELHLPPPRLISRALTLKLFPGIDDTHLTGGAQWYDYQMVENDRVTLAFAAAADRAGCVLANYVEAESALRRNGRVAGVLARDVDSGRTLTVEAKLTINAAGARAGEIRKMFGVDRPLPLIGAMNLVTSKPAGEVALAAPDAAGRMLTLVPWRGRAIVGTAQSTQVLHAPQDYPTSTDLNAFIARANEAFPALRMSREDVTLVHRGAVPAHAAGSAELLAAARIETHESEGAAGGMTVVGVKYTTARAVAERAVNAAARLLRTRLARSATASTVLPGAGIADHEALAIETARRARLDLPLASLKRLAALYAERSADVIRLAAGRAELREPIGNTPAIAAEIVHAIREEMAVRLSDVVVRRTGLGAAGYPGAEIVGACAAVAGVELGWSEERIRTEVERIERFYALPS